jgi:cobalt-zinc-cadmium efflux system outer membrane protein
MTGCLASLCLFAIAGCQVGPVPSPDTESAVSVAAGVGADAIAFSADRSPDDVRSLPPGTLSAADAITAALRGSPELQAALARVRVAEADSRQARLLPNPVLSVVFRLSTSSGTPNVDAGLAQELISVLQRPGRARVADARLRGAAVEAVTVALDVVTDVRERLAAIQGLDRLIAVLGERRTLVDRLAQLAKAKLDAGEGTRLDLLTLQAQRIELDTDLADREQERRAQRLALSKLVGEPSGAADWTVGPIAPPGRAASEHEWVALGLERRPEVQARQWEVAAREADLAQARLAPFDGTSVGVAAERDGEWSVGPSVEGPLPVFDTGRQKRARAEAALAEARHEMTRTRRTVIEEARQAHASLVRSQANLARVRDELIPVQQRRLDQAEAQYKTGQTDITSLFVVEQDVRAARSKLVELERKAIEAQIRLERAAGGPGVASAARLTSPATTAATTRPTTVK